jgi:hypothetical protein
VDVRDYGAKADNGATDNSGPIQAAIDALAAKIGSNTNGPKGIVYIPSAPLPYTVYKTIWVDSPNIEIQGDGWGSEVAMSQYFKHNVFQFGIRRVEQAVVNGAWTPVSIDAAHRPDLYGILDTTVVSAPGQKWGLRTHGDSFIQFQASPLSSGPASALGGFCSDYWGETTQLTIDCCIAPPPSQQFPGTTPLFGMGVGYWQPSPLTVLTTPDGSGIWVTFVTDDIGPGYNIGNHGFQFSLSGFTAPYRIAFQIDLVNAVFTAYVNGKQVSVSSTGWRPWQPGTHFIQNDVFPLMVGVDNIRSPYLNAPTGIDLSVYGLRFSNTIRYQNNGAGNPQHRVDSPLSAITDLYSYFTNDANTVAYLALTDNPATALRTVSVQHGQVLAYGGVGSGYFMSTAGSGGIMNNAIRNICVTSSNGHSQAISIGAVLEMQIENVRATGGFHAIGSWNMLANYFIHINNCHIQGYDSSYYGCMQLIDGHDICCLNSGKVSIRLYGCGGNWKNIFVVRPTLNAECTFKLHGYDYGGNHYIENVLVDFEGYTLSLAGIYCEAHGLAPATSLVLKDIFFGTVGAGAALVMLKDMSYLGGEYNRCWLSMENVQAFTNTYLAAVDVDGPLWHGEVKGVALSGPQFNHRQKWGTNTNIIIRDTKYIAPPRTSSWYSGAHAFEVRTPCDNQFSEWRCVASGTYGTATPPQWAGLNPLCLTASGLAAYVFSHCYVKVSLN